MKRTHRFDSPAQCGPNEPSSRFRLRRRRHTPALGLAAATIFVLFSTLSHAARAESRPFCSQTADLLFTACKASVVDDGNVARTICLNISDDAARGACLDDMASERSDGMGLCRDQHDLRLQTCKLLGEARYDPLIDPAAFESDVANLDHPNPYFPLTIGNRWTYRSTEELNTVEATDETKSILGVTCVVFRDKVFRNGDLTESTDDWFGQQSNGTVWYFGEEAKEYESFDGDNPRRPELVSFDGAFKAGRNGDKPGIIFEAAPHVGDIYLEEFSLGNAEDASTILSTTYAFGAVPDLDQNVPRALVDRFCSGNCIVVKGFSLLEPGTIERKYYAPGIGVILEVEFNEDGVVVNQLTDCNFDARCHNLPNP